MLKKFKTKELVFIALMAVLLFVINFILGAWLNALTGIPFMNGVVTGITFGIFMAIMARTLPKFWTFTLFFLIYSLIELPTNLGGAPGFWPKIPINILTGLAADIFLFSFRYKRWSYYPGFIILSTVNLFAFIFFLNLLGMPGVRELLGIVWWLLPLYWILGSMGIIVGHRITDRLENNKTYLQIKEDV